MAINFRMCIIRTNDAHAQSRHIVNSVRVLGVLRQGLFAFLVELDFLSGRDKLRDYEVFSIIHYA